jgi:ankyrin repeat protein
MEAAKQKKNGMALVEQLFHAKPSLAELNLDLNAQDRQGESALLEAARAGNPDIVKFLIERGANVNVANRRGETPIIEMAKYPYQAPVDALLKCGANACARDTNHRTAIIETAKHGYMSILENLLVHLEGRLSSKKRLIVINSVDHESRTAVDWAKEGGFDDCVKLLREHGGKSVDETEFVVFTTPDGKCYHRLDCGTISISRERKTLKRRLLRDAVKAHFELCDKCKPSLEEIDWAC